MITLARFKKENTETYIHSVHNLKYADKLLQERAVAKLKMISETVGKSKKSVFLFSKCMILLYVNFPRSEKLHLWEYRTSVGLFGL